MPQCRMVCERGNVLRRRGSLGEQASRHSTPERKFLPGNAFTITKPRATTTGDL